MFGYVANTLSSQPRVFSSVSSVDLGLGDRLASAAYSYFGGSNLSYLADEKYSPNFYIGELGAQISGRFSSLAASLLGRRRA